MRNLIVILITVSFTFSAAMAGDLGLVKIQNEYQALVAQGIIDQAYARVDQGYLVLVSKEQASMLNRSGIEYRVVMTDVDPSLTYLVYPPEKPGAAVANMAGSVEIGMGLRVVQTDSPLSLGPTAHFGPRAVLLDELQVQIRYIPKAIYDFLSALDEYPTDTIANFVDMDSAYAYVTRLEAFQTRYIFTDSIDAARDWMVQKFLDWGYTDVTTPDFYYGGQWHYNVMAVKPGASEPDKVIVIGGHYDSITYGVSPGPLYYAPGADDNATGTTVALELARILSGLTLRKTVVFMAFSAEEVGLVGSLAAANSFVQSGTDVEVMLNFDMVAHDPNNLSRVNLSSGENTAYRKITADAANRVTSVIPVITSMGSSSDHYSFYTRGFDVVDAIEYDFNDLGWHTNLDVSDRLNFPYFTEILKMAAAAVGVIANSAHPTFITEVVDQGDGQSVEVFWSDCDPTYSYTLRYGTSSGTYSYALPVPPDQCSYVVNGLTEGQTYFFSVKGEVPGAYPAAYVTEDSGSSYVLPRAPANLSAEPILYAISLDWDDNREADLSHYRVYRDEGSGLVLYQDNVMESRLLDSDVVGLVDYTYRVSAVDVDLNESQLSNPIVARAYTFDQGILVVDETADDFYLPSEAEQDAYFDSIFAGTPYGLDKVAGMIDTLPRQTAGSYSSMFWFDDDPGYKDIAYNESTIDWYVGNQVNAFIAGWKTISSWVASPIDTDHTLYEDFGVASYVVNSVRDFAGAIGQNGWPSLSMATDNLWEGKFPYIPILTPRPGATVIYTYDSFIDDPAFEGEPCGILYETVHGKRIALAFPVYFLTASSSRDLVQHTINFFGESADYVYGDVNNSGGLDPLDAVYFVNYLWKGGPAPINMNAGDVDASCVVDIVDAVYLINYLYRSGPAPQAGCVY